MSKHNPDGTTEHFLSAPMVMVTVCYDHGNTCNRDEAADAIADQFGAEFCGAGCWMEEPFPRDMQYEVGADRADQFAAALTAAGFTCTVYPAEDSDDN